MPQPATLALFVASLAGGAAMVARQYRRAMAEAARHSDPQLSQIAPTRHGPMEYAIAGSGPSLLMLHGTGGGFDQGLEMGAPLIEAGYRLIAPSRFGYLRTKMPEAASPQAEADACADLLDHLGIEKVFVLGGSAGAIPAAAFAALHPDRVSAVVALVPAILGPERALPRPWSAWQERVALAVLGSDFLFWLVRATLPRFLTRTILASDAALLDAATDTERERVASILDSILPISRKAAGLMNDAHWANSPVEFDLSPIKAPTLAISMEDDFYQTAEGARYVASQVPGAELLLYPTGGHVWIGRNSELFAAIDSFLRRSGAGLS